MTMGKFAVNIAFALAAFASAGANAQDVSGYPVGHCNGEINTRSCVKHPGAGEWVSAAVWINPEYAAAVAGNRIESIKAGLCSTIHVDSLRVWVRRTLDGADLAAGGASASGLAKGWNTLGLDTPWEIPSAPGEGFYIGFSILQDGKSAGPAVLTARPGEGTFFLRLGDGPWEDRSAEGTLCVEGLAFGDNLPKRNVELVSVASAPHFIMSEGTLEAVAEVRNKGTLTVTRLEAAAEIDGAPRCVAEAECRIPYGEVQKVRFVLRPELDSPDPASRGGLFTIAKVDGEADENMSDNSAALSFSVMERAFRRMAFVEEFTTERCPNCPAAADKLHSVLSDPEYSGSVVAVCHHSGYYTDWLTIPSDEEYVWFYNSGSTFAPAMMVDRLPSGGETSAVFFPKTEEMLRERLARRLAVPALVSVNVSVSVDAGDAATVRVEGERLSPGLEGAAITVFLVENDVAARSQAGSGDGYLHQHVSRAVSSTWGEPVEWSGDTYSYECSFVLSDTWKRGDMEAVAVVGRYSADDPLACAVENAGRAPLGQAAAGVVHAGEGAEAYYDARGMRLAARPAEGFFITVRPDGTSEKGVARR